MAFVGLTVAVLRLVEPAPAIRNGTSDRFDVKKSGNKKCWREMMLRSIRPLFIKFIIFFSLHKIRKFWRRREQIASGVMCHISGRARASLDFLKPYLSSGSTKVYTKLCWACIRPFGCLRLGLCHARFSFNVSPNFWLSSPSPDLLYLQSQDESKSSPLFEIGDNSTWFVNGIFHSAPSS